ncbi:hypothetical protein FF1_032448 [Malus domestica]
MHMNGEGFESGDPESDPRHSQLVSQVDPKPKDGVDDQAADLLFPLPAQLQRLLSLSGGERLNKLFWKSRRGQHKGLEN